MGPHLVLKRLNLHCDDVEHAHDALRSGPRGVLLIHAGRLVERGRRLIFKARKAVTEELQAALDSLGERSTLPG